MESELRFKNGKRFKMTPVCNLQQVGIKMQRNEHATTPKHDNKIHAGIHSRCLKKSSTELWPIHPLTGSNKHGKNAYDKQISDLVKLSLDWNFRSDSTL